MKSLSAFFFVLFLSARPAFAEPLAPAVERLLVVAPHPDDETLGAAGAVLAAKEAGAAVRVLFLTHGESNAVSSIFHLKKPTVVKGDFLRNGEIRRREALEAADELGLAAADLVFLGYPDSGLEDIWRRHWGAAAPYKNLLTRWPRVPHAAAASRGSDHRAENVLRDVKKEIEAFKPTRVLVTAPFDSNGDHRAAFGFVRLALLELEGSFPEPELEFYLVHARRWPRPKSLEPERSLEAPREQAWREPRVFPLKPEWRTRKHQALLRYRSQIAYSKKFLLSFVRRNELFFAAGPAKLEELAPEADSPPLPSAVGRVALSFSIRGKELWVRARFKESVDELGALDIELFPYRKGTAFGSMPKYRLRLFGRKLFAFLGPARLSDRRIAYALGPDGLTVRMPLSMLRDPDALFVSASTAKRGASPATEGWRLVRK